MLFQYILYYYIIIFLYSLELIELRSVNYVGRTNWSHTYAWCLHLFVSALFLTILAIKST